MSQVPPPPPPEQQYPSTVPLSSILPTTLMNPHQTRSSSRTSRASSSAIQGLEFSGLDLPDSVGEFVVSGVLVLQCERVLQLISHFMQARKQKGSDHGVKAHGDGWLLTGKTRTSSIKFQKSEKSDKEHPGESAESAEDGFGFLEKEYSSRQENSSK